MCRILSHLCVGEHGYMVTTATNPVAQFCEQFGCTLRELDPQLDISHSQLSLYRQGRKPIPRYVVLALRELKRDKLQSAIKGRAPDGVARDGPKCPECGESARLRPDHLSHWFHGRLKMYAYCKGARSQPHPKIKFGILAGEREWRRIDLAESRVTKKDVPLLGRKSKSAYERRHGWVWCDACGWICRSSGKYSFHTHGDQKGTVYTIFRCTNPHCPKPARLKCLGGKTFRRLPHSGRVTTLPPFARKCRCGGRTVRNGTYNELIRVRCRGKCRRVFYCTQKRIVANPKRGGPLAADLHRPRCAGGDTVHLWRLTLRAYRIRRKIRAVPLSVRAAVNEQIRSDTLLNDVVLKKYWCRHTEVWKLPNGRTLHTHYRRPADRRLQHNQAS
jgi:hypothetical protein